MEEYEPAGSSPNLGTDHSEIVTYFYLAIKNKMNRTNHVRENIKHNVTHQSKH